MSLFTERDSGSSRLGYEERQIKFWKYWTKMWCRSGKMLHDGGGWWNKTEEDLLGETALQRRWRVWTCPVMMQSGIKWRRKIKEGNWLTQVRVAKCLLKCMCVCVCVCT